MALKMDLNIVCLFITEHITVHCDVYDPTRSIYNHMTPYTRWIMYIYEPRSADIDISDVTHINMELIGSANIV